MKYYKISGTSQFVGLDENQSLDDFINCLYSGKYLNFGNEIFDSLNNGVYVLEVLKSYVKSQINNLHVEKETGKGFNRLWKWKGGNSFVEIHDLYDKKPEEQLILPVGETNEKTIKI